MSLKKGQSLLHHNKSSIINQDRESETSVSIKSKISVQMDLCKQIEELDVKILKSVKGIYRLKDELDALMQNPT